MTIRRTGSLALGLLLAACARPPGGPGVAKAAPPPGTGTLEIRVTDALDGKPIARCMVVGWDAGTSTTEVTPSGDDVAADGLHRFAVPPNLRRVRIAAKGYSEKWSGDAGVAAGRTKPLAVSLSPLSRLVVRVVPTDGSTVPDGALLLTGPDRTETMVVKGGVADQRVDAGTVDVQVDPDFLSGYAPQGRRVTLVSGERTDLTLEVVRHR